MKRNQFETIQKKRGLMLLCVLSALVLSGCAKASDTLISPQPNYATQMPGQQLKDDMERMLPDMSPNASASPNTDMPVNSSNVPDTPEKSKQASKEMEDAIDLLSEVDDAAVVAIGNRALVGIEFEDAYHGNLDDRIRSMILTRVQTVSKGVSSVYVTQDPTLYQKIDALDDKLETAASLSELTDEFDKLTKEIPVYTK